MDLTALTGAVDFAPVATAFLAVGALKVVPVAIAWGVRRVLGMVGR